MQVSVIIPTHNRAGTLLRAIGSVLAQTHSVSEIIIVDDNSSDGTAEIIGGLLKQDRRIRYLQTRRRLGAASARNYGVAASTGDLVAFLDSDDAWEPMKVELQVAAYEEMTELVACFTLILEIEKDNKTRVRRCPSAVKYSDLARRNLIGSTSSCMVRRDAFLDAGGFADDLPSCQDWDLWLRLSKLGALYVVQNALTLYFFDGEGRISKSRSSVIDGHRRVYGGIYNREPSWRRRLALWRYHLLYWSWVYRSLGMHGRFFLLSTCSLIVVERNDKREALSAFRLSLSLMLRKP